jgi:fructose-specific phosphotransferase system IIC component
MALAIAGTHKNPIKRITRAAICSAVGGTMAILNHVSVLAPKIDLTSSYVLQYEIV